ncbi:uncharacterized protein F5147DRAFT_430054 [Suillus discolor]|uniref:Uncharacterized protein n=1 Tax=Suillus discolor TaxID=1912936 RepID=A0A9P7JXP6_9AGAM|nr:uncharacterized protein F5147DRAFT_430054 [Suillus discolor]KAG2114644.1 hypothetical protein F5147DRAFT_430054 [Suillus discolor]
MMMQETLPSGTQTLCGPSDIVIGMLFVNTHPLLTILRVVGFGPSRVRCNVSVFITFSGGIAAWLQGWLFGPAVPKGNGSAMLQRLAMMGKARL